MYTVKTRKLNLKYLVASSALALMVLAIALSQPVLADAHEEEGANVRIATVQVRAMVTDVDTEARELTLQLPGGSFVTMAAGEAATRLHEIAAGDTVVATYITSLAGEVREPTAEELANPWQELEATAIAGFEVPPGVAEMRVIKAVCTIEGMNRVAGTVMIQDPRGKFHLIGDIEREQFEGRTLGETLIVVYSEAVAVAIEAVPVE
jgi:hypothetical protein